MTQQMKVGVLVVPVSYPEAVPAEVIEIEDLGH